MDPLGLVLDLANTGLTMYNNAQNRKFSEQQATTAYERQVALMNMQNEYNAAYNDPSAQVQRLVNAGLNPNLAYGQVGSAIANSSAPSVAQGAAYNQNDPQLLLQNAMVSKQMENIDVQNDIKKQQLEQDIKESFTRMGVNENNASYLAALTGAVPMSIAQMEANIANMSYERRSMGYDIAMKSLSFSDRLQQYSVDLEKSKTELKYLGEYYTASIYNLESQAKRALAAANLDRANTDVAREVAKLYSLEGEYSQEELNRFRQYNREYYDKKYQSDYGYYTPFQYEMFGQNARNQYQFKLNDILHKYGDTKEVMSLIHLGTECFENVTDGIQSIGSFNFTRKKTKRIR